METCTKLPASFGQRCLALNAAAHSVRQRATRDGDDLDGWRLSRLMRDACTTTKLMLLSSNTACGYGRDMLQFGNGRPQPEMGCVRRRRGALNLRAR